jgi:hypothetical protein
VTQLDEGDLVELVSRARGPACAIDGHQACLHPAALKRLDELLVFASGGCAYRLYLHGAEPIRALLDLERPQRRFARATARHGHRQSGEGNHGAEALASRGEHRRHVTALETFDDGRRRAPLRWRGDAAQQSRAGRRNARECALTWAPLEDRCDPEPMSHFACDIEFGALEQAILQVLHWRVALLVDHEHHPAHSGGNRTTRGATRRLEAD